MEEWEFGLQRVINFPQGRKQSERTYLLKTLAGCPVDKLKIERFELFNNYLKIHKMIILLNTIFLFRLLNVTILNQNSNFTDSDIQLVYSTLTGSATGYFTLFDFLVDHWDNMKQRFMNKQHLWDGLVNSATSSFTTQEGYDLVSQLYIDRQADFDPVGSVMKKVMGDIEEELKWSKRNLPIIEGWLKHHLGNNPSPLMSSMRQTTANEPIAG